MLEFLLYLQQMRTPVMDAVFLTVTRLGEELFVLAPLLLCYWCLDKELGLHIGFIYFAGGIVNQFSKLIFRIERPFILDARIQPHPAAVGSATGYSFPSGHTTSATSLAAAFALHFRKKWWVWLLCGAYVALVGFSRMYLGVHTPADVLCGFLFTAAMAAIVELAWRDCAKHPRHGVYYLLLCGAAALGMLIYAQWVVSSGLAPEDQAADAFKTGGAALALLLGIVLDHRFLRFNPRASRRAQIVKFVVGVALALLLKEGLKLLLGTSLPMQFLRYFITVLFIVIGYPFAFTRILQKKRPT